MTQLYRSSLILILLFGVIFNTNAQVGIGTNSPSASAMLDVESSTKGFLYPRMSNSQMSAISSPAAGLTIYNTDASALYCYNGANWVSKEDKVTGLFNAGTAAQLDNIRVQMPNSGNAYSMQIATVSGTLSLSGSCELLSRTSPTATGGSAATYDSYIRQSETLTTTFINFWPGLNLGYHGTTQLLNVRDETNNHAYHIIFTVGGGYLKNFISIKRLY
jgi:hypothetical protein